MKKLWCFTATKLRLYHHTTYNSFTVTRSTTTKSKVILLLFVLLCRNQLQIIMHRCYVCNYPKIIKCGNRTSIKFRE